MKSIRQRNLKLSLDAPVTQTIYNERGQVLLTEGQIIPSPEALQKIYQIGFVLQDRPVTIVPPKQDFLAELGQKIIVHERQFDILYTLQDWLKSIYEKAPHSFEEPLAWQKDLNQLILFLNHLYDKDKSQIIGLYQLYSLEAPWHSKTLQGALLIKLLAESYGYSHDTQSLMMAIFLTMDLGMPSQIYQWEQQKEPLSSEQWAHIRAHPYVGAEWLQKLGVTSPLWLQVVQEHHERLDGSGYPHQLTQPNFLSQMVAVVDTYTALNRQRGDRDAIPAQAALRYLYLERGKGLNADIVEKFVKVLGVFPTGSFVKLNNHETAIVVSQHEQPLQPIIKAVQGTDGLLLETAPRRNPSSTPIVGMTMPFNHKNTLTLTPMIWKKQLLFQFSQLLQQTPLNVFELSDVVLPAP